VTNVKRSVALIAVIFGIGISGLAVAQTTSTTPATPAPATTPAPAQKPVETKPKSTVKKAKNAIGTVKSASTDSLVVAGKEKGKDTEWTFAVDAKTAIRKSGKAITAADLKPGDHVQVRYMDHEGTATAMAVQVKPGATSAKAAPVEKK
jgi:hypothetical protein